MRVLCCNACGWGFKHLFRDFPDQVGWLISPGCWKTPFPGLYYALDNAAFSAWTNGTEWNESAWRRLLDKSAKHHRPAWALVPDVVANREATLERWHRYRGELRARGIPAAFAVQDGMLTGDVPEDADLIFVGGTYHWKWSSLPMWVSRFKRVHVGRVRQSKLLICKEFNVESCDGTGWFREGQDGKPARFLRAFLSGLVEPHPRLFHVREAVNNL